MTLRVACCNCGDVRSETYRGWIRGNARDAFVAYLGQAGWASVQGEWYCGSCSRAARLADTGYLVPTIGGDAKGVRP